MIELKNWIENSMEIIINRVRLSPEHIETLSRGLSFLSMGIKAKMLGDDEKGKADVEKYTKLIKELRIVMTG
jgi:hypothetical protein